MNELKEDVEVRRSLPEDLEMDLISERIFCFAQKREVTFEQSFMILLIEKLDTLDRTIHNSTLEIGTAINDIGGRRW